MLFTKENAEARSRNKQFNVGESFIKRMAEAGDNGKVTKRRLRNMEVEQVGVVNGGKLVKATEIARKIKSFDHFIYVWGYKAGYYLPPKNVLTWHYISQVLAHEKHLLKVERVGHEFEVPKARGSVVNDIFHRIKDTNGLHYYFPDLTETQNVPHNYFFNVSLRRCFV